MPSLLLGAVGVLLGLVLPFAPVWATTTTISWPATGQDVRSATAVVVPYRPADLVATVPCSVAERSGPAVDLLATGTGDEGLIVRSAADGVSVRLDGRSVDVPVVGNGADCRVVITAGTGGVSIAATGQPPVELADQPVPRVFGFRTGLSVADAAGLSVTADIVDPFGTSPGVLKTVLIVGQLLAAGIALVLLHRASRRWRHLARRARRLRWRSVWWIDVAVVATFAAWAVIGPLAVDDGWATTIARTFAESGSPGNYYRWWNAAEVPFALDQQVLAPLTQVSLAPLWLRLPSTVLAVATWWVLSRGVLPAALPTLRASTRVRLVAAISLLMAWLPFNLGARPESYVALGVTTVLALAMRSRSVGGLAAMMLAAALTVPISPSAILVVAPMVVFAPRLLAVLKSSSPTRLHLVANVALLSCIGAVGLTVIFADQTWDALLTATDWHTFFGPSLPWYRENVRYEYLLQSDQQGSFAKRLPVLTTVAMLPIVGLLVFRGGKRDALARKALRLAAVVLLGLLLFAISPSKWSYHLGAAAGLFAALLTVGIVLVVRRARAPDRDRMLVGAGGSVLLILAFALAFDGPNAWWQPAVYDVPWATGPPRPLGVPLNNPLTWAVVLVVVAAVSILLRRSPNPRRALVAAPALLVGSAFAVALMLLVGSFAAAPLRQPSGSLARANVDRVTGSKVCGLADDVELLPDGAVLTPAAEPGGQLDGFVVNGGYPALAPPPEPPGRGASAFVWGTDGPAARSGATMTSPWFVLPPQGSNGGVAVSVSGRLDDGNQLRFEFGRVDGSAVTVLGEDTPADRPASDEDPTHPLWRSIGLDANGFPQGADRVRIRAVGNVAARTDGFDWLAFTGPRLRSIVPLNQFLADNRPVLVTWPQAFLFPCVLDIATVSGGVAQTPRAVIESPRPWLKDDRKRDIGGTFHELEVFGDLQEIPSRLVGAPTVDWGSVQVSADTAGRDAYRRTTTRALVPGAGGVRHAPPEH